MRRMTMFMGTIATGMVLPLSSQAAAIYWTFEAENVNYTALPGDTISVKVYLHETASASPTILSEGGLFSSGFKVDLTGLPPSDPAEFISLTGNTAAFDKAIGGTTTSASASLWAEQDTLFPNGAVPDGSGRILLGTLSIQAGLVNGEITNFTIGDYGASDQTVTYNFTALDGQISNTTGFDVTVVPEPTSLSLLSLGGFLMLRRRRA